MNSVRPQPATAPQASGTTNQPPAPASPRQPRRPAATSPRSAAALSSPLSTCSAATATAFAQRRCIILFDSPASRAFARKSSADSCVRLFAKLFPPLERCCRDEQRTSSRPRSGFRNASSQVVAIHGFTANGNPPRNDSFIDKVATPCAKRKTFATFLFARRQSIAVMCKQIALS